MSNEPRSPAPSGEVRRANRLADSTSPYLLQHASNPVDWYPWGPEALERARREDRPIFLSVGYSACHWCHVMERESFESDEIAAIMNEHFVNIKVDREERPDIDEIYMNAVQAMTGQGGWPMSVFLTPELRPFFGGTYFPPQDGYGRPSFRRVLVAIAEQYQTRRDNIEESAGRLTELLRQTAAARGPEIEVRHDLVDAAAQQLLSRLDRARGGFGEAPKFPQAMSLSLLLRVHRRTGEPAHLQAAELTLDRMARGGMYDQVGGGFHRYSVDNEWLVPHFEKMLYDNALLARTYLEAHQVTGDAFYGRIATEILDYVLRDMTSDEGGFYSATDADSEGVEGKYFVWSPPEIKAVLGNATGDVVCRFYDVTETGNWEGTSILRVQVPEAEFAAREGMSVEELQALLADAREQLRRARDDRVPPLLDDKIITSWNALMLGSFARAYRATDEPRYRQAAERAAELILHEMRDGERLLRTRRRGRSQLAAYLEDYAFLTDALLDLYEATFELRWIHTAVELAGYVHRHFWDAEGGGYYFTADDHEELLARSKSPLDNAIPSGNSMALMSLVRLGRLTGQDEYLERARRTLGCAGPLLEQAPSAFAQLLQGLELLAQPSREVVIAGSLDDDRTRTLVRAVGRRFLPDTVTAHADPAVLEQSAGVLPVVAGRTEVDGQPAAYVCQDFACRAPVTTSEELEKLLGVSVGLTSRAGAGGAGQVRVVGIDTGGTFTDLCGWIDGRLVVRKVLSDRADPGAAVLRALGELASESVDVVHGTTVATNALLERRGARVALVTTAGFEDVLEIGRQARPDPYALEPRRTPPLVPRERRLGVRGPVGPGDAREGPAGRPGAYPTAAELADLRDRLTELEVDAVAVVLLYSYLDPAGEERVGESLSSGTWELSLSSRVRPVFREYERTSTTVANAYVAPLMSRYLRGLEDRAPRPRWRVMASNAGSLTLDTAARLPGACLLSGPAGGVLAAARVAAQLGVGSFLTLDMGGTSTDVCLVDGAIPTTDSGGVAGLPVAFPAVDIHTVGAGGGSVVRLDRAGVLRVGPESAGADPGPIAYGRGARPTVTDANLLLGRIPVTTFHRLVDRVDAGEGAAIAAGDVTAPASDEPRGRVERAFTELGEKLGTSPEGAALAALASVEASMARALRVISTRRGRDPRGMALICFGGAGPLHGAALAAALGIDRVIVPPFPGALSAAGLAGAEARRDYVRAVLRPVDAELNAAALQGLFDPLLDEARRNAAGAGQPESALELRESLDLRYRGQSYEIEIPWTPEYSECFHAEHQRRYGHSDAARPLELVHVRVTAVSPGAAFTLRAAPPGDAPAAVGAARVVAGPSPRAALEAALIVREKLAPSTRIDVPAVLTEATATTWVPPGWTGTVAPCGSLIMTPVHGGGDAGRGVGTEADDARR